MSFWMATMVRKRRISKEAAQRLHAKRRAKQRYGLVLENKDLAIIRDKIKRGDCYHLETQSNRVSVKLVYYRDLWMRVVYDKNRSQVVTFLPPKQYEHLYVSKD